MIELIIYSRPGCHLCDDMKAVVTRVAGASALSLAIREIDISTDRELEARYGFEIPVLLVDGKKVAKYRVTEADLLRIVMDRAGRAGGAG